MILFSGIASVRALLRGCLYIAYYRLFNPNVKIKWPFFVHMKFQALGQNIQILGPGKVFIDRCCSIWPNIFHGLSIVTLTPAAHVIIGSHCSLGGLTIRCRNCVTIGNKTITANSLIQDCLFVHLESAKSCNPALSGMDGSPVNIGNNVWLGGQSLVLGGSSVGSDSVVSWGATLHDTLVKEYCLVSGNPAQRPLPIPSILRLTGPV